jgi:23S rRNA U2552 (ribose-2'-O)-methylase RlmE/FtsJ
MLMVWKTTRDESKAFDFKENSKAMFTDVCNASPKLVRHFSRETLVKGLKKHICGKVYESTMYEVCK